MMGNYSDKPRFICTKTKSGKGLLPFPDSLLQWKYLSHGSAIYGLGNALQQYHAMGCHTLVRTGKAQSLLGGGFYADLLHIAAQLCCQIFPHLRNMGCQLRCLRQHGCIYIADAPPLALDQPIDMIQQL